MSVLLQQQQHCPTTTNNSVFQRMTPCPKTFVALYTDTALLDMAKLVEQILPRWGLYSPSLNIIHHCSHHHQQSHHKCWNIDEATEGGGGRVRQGVVVVVGL